MDSVTVIHLVTGIVLGGLFAGSVIMLHRHDNPENRKIRRCTLLAGSVITTAFLAHVFIGAILTLLIGLAAVLYGYYAPGAGLVVVLAILYRIGGCGNGDITNVR